MDAPLLFREKGEVVLSPDRDRPVRNRHPWVFSGAVAEVRGEVTDGDLVGVRDSAGAFLGRGTVAPRAAIRVRMLSFDDRTVTPQLLTDRIRKADARRSRILNSATTACRIVNGEGDLLPGLEVDRYGEFLVCRFATAGMERRRECILGALEDQYHPAGIYLRAAREVRESEGLTLRGGSLAGETPPPRVEIVENGFRFLVDIPEGQKTGFYLDQRDNRAWIRRIAVDRRVLNCHAYTGAFTVSALAGDASSVVSVDRSRPALDLARENVEINGFGNGRAEFVVSDAVEYLRAAEPGAFDLIVLDPPALARNKGTLSRATRAYKELNRQAFRILPAEGLLLTCSCSRPLDRSLFRKVIFGAALDAGREVQVVGESGHPMDHPVSIYHPEGEYLKALLLRVA
jgi:23S rRNA (cytosine1962-C5)-methyltransferase